MHNCLRYLCFFSLSLAISVRSGDLSLSLNLNIRPITILPGYLRKFFLHLRKRARVSSLSVGFDILQQQQTRGFSKKESVSISPSWAFGAYLNLEACVRRWTWRQWSVGSQEASVPALRWNSHRTRSGIRCTLSKIYTDHLTISSWLCYGSA